MSNALPQKRSEVCSVTAGEDANDSGFSELCHGAGGEEGAWQSSRSIGEDGGPPEKTFRQVYVHRASTPNRSVQYHYPVPIGIPFCSPDSVTKIDYKRENVNMVSYNGICSYPEPMVAHGQLYRDSRVTFVPKLPYVLSGARCADTGIGPASTCTSSENTGSHDTSGLTSSNLLASQVRPVSYYDATSFNGMGQLLPPVKAEPSVADDAPINSKSSVSAQTFDSSQKYIHDFKEVGLRDTGILIKRESETVPVLDLRRQPVGTVDQLLKVPSSYGTVSLALPEVRTLQLNHRTPPITTTQQDRVSTSAIASLLAAEQASYTYGVSSSTTLADTLPRYTTPSFGRNETLKLKSETKDVFDVSPTHSHTFLSDGLSSTHTDTTFRLKSPTLKSWSPFYSPAKSSSDVKYEIAEIDGSSSIHSRTISFSDTTDDGQSPIPHERLSNDEPFALDASPCVSIRKGIMESPNVDKRGRVVDSPFVSKRGRVLDSPCVSKRGRMVDSPCVSERGRMTDIPCMSEEGGIVDSPCTSESGRVMNKTRVSEREQVLDNPFLSGRKRTMDSPYVSERGRTVDTLSTIRPQLDEHATIISDFSEDEVSGTKTIVDAGRADTSSPYSDISGEDTHSDRCAATSESSGEEETRAALVSCAAARKNRKWKRKSMTPRRSPDKRDPRFKGVTIWLQTEFKNGNSQLHLSAFYSNVKVGATKPAYVMRRPVVLPGDCHSCSEAEGFSPPTHNRDTYVSAVKTCASCRTRRTPLWRDAEDGTPLCNACGIRYKKYRLRCSRCWFIPKKDIKTYPNCPACGSALRYSFHRKAW